MRKREVQAKLAHSVFSVSFPESSLSPWVLEPQSLAGDQNTIEAQEPQNNPEKMELGRLVHRRDQKVDRVRAPM